MAKVRPPAPAGSLVVPTKELSALGQPVVQVDLPPPEPPANPEPKPAGEDFPSQSFVEWALEKFTEIQTANRLYYRFSDLLIWCLFSQASYYVLDTVLPVMQDCFPGLQFQRFSGVGPGLVGWDEYIWKGYRVLVFPGTENFNELTDYVGFSMVKLTGQPDNFRFFKGLATILQNYEDAVWGQYQALFQTPQPGFLFAGHSLGGVVSNWLAYRLNKRSALQVNQKKPVFSVFTYGAPAGWVDMNGTENFLSDHKHYRSVAPGDPVPGITQSAILNSPYAFGIQAGNTLPPVHYASLDAMLLEAREQLRFSNALGDSYLNFLASSIPNAQALAANHSVANYGRCLFKACRLVHDTPFDLFPKLENWFNTMNVPGLAKRV